MDQGSLQLSEEERIERLYTQVTDPSSTTEERRKAIEALVAYGPRAIQTLYDISDYSVDSSVREYALESIKRLRETTQE